jgi:hypothetical protein
VPQVSAGRGACSKRGCAERIQVPSGPSFEGVPRGAGVAARCRHRPARRRLSPCPRRPPWRPPPTLARGTWRGRRAVGGAGVAFSLPADPPMARGQGVRQLDRAPGRGPSHDGGVSRHCARRATHGGGSGIGRNRPRSRRGPAARGRPPRRPAPAPPRRSGGSRGAAEPMRVSRALTPRYWSSRMTKKGASHASVQRG